MIKLRLKGYTDYRIGKTMRKPQISVTRSLSRFEEDYRLLVKFIKDVRRTKYFQSKYLKSLRLWHRHVADAKEQLLAQGIPLVHPNMSLPGYKVVNSVIEVDRKTVPQAKRIFEAYRDGENMARLFRDLKLDPRFTLKIIRNPIFVGEIHFRSKVYRFPHLAIIDRKLWEECQPPEVKFPRQLLGPKLFGFKRKAGRFVKDPKKAPIVEQMFDLLFEDKNMSEIGRKFDLSPSAINRLFKNPKYAGKAKVDGDYVDVPFEVIIPFGKWLKAQVLIEVRAKRFSVEARKRLQISRRDAILSCLLERPEGARSAELKNITGRSKCTLSEDLHQLKVGGFVQWRREGRYRKWYITESGKRRIKEQPQ